MFRKDATVSGTLGREPLPLCSYAGIMGWTKKDYLSNKKKLLAKFRNGEDHYDFVKSIVDELKAEVEVKKLATWEELGTDPKELAMLLKKARR
ncbi:MAG: hypothetical protein NT116_05520 [Candidatus Parcubacteria bacterium]|nr:hypothetical protein [Candidatus Parcubacteria bacterium]